MSEQEQNTPALDAFCEAFGIDRDGVKSVFMRLESQTYSHGPNRDRIEVTVTRRVHVEQLGKWFEKVEEYRLSPASEPRLREEY